MPDQRQERSDRKRRLAAHKAPAWFEDAKLGIFIHWGLYSVPGWAKQSRKTAVDLVFEAAGHDSPYAEWYWNALRQPGSETAAYHAAHFPGCGYEDFRTSFHEMLEGWDAGSWADLFARAGARYVVLTTKHHDGYLLWPSAQPNPFRPDWQVERDVVGDLAAAVRARGMRFGVYYSGGLDWTWKHEPSSSLAGIMANMPRTRGYASYVDAHYRELIERYRPSVLWNDIGHPPDLDLRRLLVDYLTAVPDGAVNDRFIKAPPGEWLLDRPRVRRVLDAAIRTGYRMMDGNVALPMTKHADFRTPEYGTFGDVSAEKWETTRGIGQSFGYNRAEQEGDHLDVEELILGFIDTVSKNGNLLLNVGPDGDGHVPRMQASRLEALGGWLTVNGDAVYGTRPWIRAEGMTSEGLPVRFTHDDTALFAALLGTPRRATVVVRDVPAPEGVHVLGHGPTTFCRRPDGIEVALPPAAAAALAPVLRLDLGAR